jgi:hypothetical protein
MKQTVIFLIIFLLVVGLTSAILASNEQDSSHGATSLLPRDLGSYHDQEMDTVLAILKNRIAKEPFNLIASLIFLFAIIHTFISNKFTAIAHKLEHNHHRKIQEKKAEPGSVSFRAEIFHFFGEVEIIFGLWALVLFCAIFSFYDFSTAVNYIGHKVNFTEPMFVVVIMVLASTRPILKLTENSMAKVANLFGGGLVAWWFTILALGSVLGSFITEPGAMTISSLLLAKKLYDLEPSEKFKYGTMGLLFVNISVGGTLTHFAAPPVLMVAHAWDWSFSFMLLNFGWKAIIGILISNTVYYFLFKNELSLLQNKFSLIKLKEEIQKKYLKRKQLEASFEKMESIISEELGFTKACSDKFDEIRNKLKTKIEKDVKDENYDTTLFDEAFDQRFEEIELHEMRKTLPGLLPPDKRAPYFDPDWNNREDDVPVWIMIVHVFFMLWTVINAHTPALFIAGLIFFLGFAIATAPFQNRIDLKPAVLVGFFLAGLVIHGGLQGWWIAPVLGRLAEIPLMIGATILTSFNDNAAITYLSTLVPNFSPALKYAVVAGAVTGGGLTVIANAPNPAGQSILKKYFKDGISPLGLLKAALIPTIIMFLCFSLLNF